MKLTKRQLKRIIREEYSRLKRRGLIRESVNPTDINSLCSQIESNAGDWMAFEDYYEQCVMDLRVNEDEMADDFLDIHELMFFPSADWLCEVLSDPEAQQHPIFEKYFVSLKSCWEDYVFSEPEDDYWL